MKVSKNIEGLFNENTSRCKLVTFVNPYSYHILRDEFYHLVNQMDFLLADGILLVKLHNLFNRNEKIKRYSFDFTSLAPVVFDYSVTNNLNVALVGGSAGEIKKASDVLKRKYPLLNIVYTRNGFFEDKAQRIQAINDLNVHLPDILICGMGTPLQEQFIIQASNQSLSLKYCFTCGGFLSQIASRDDYFNPLLNKLNLRWFQRAYRHSYVRKRLIIDYPRFLIKFIFDNFFK